MSPFPRRLLGFAVTFDTEYKVSPLLPQVQSGCGWNERDWFESWKDQIASVRAFLAVFHQPFLMFFFFSSSRNSHYRAVSLTCYHFCTVLNALYSEITFYHNSQLCLVFLYCFHIKVDLISPLFLVFCSSALAENYWFVPLNLPLIGHILSP